MALVQYYVMKRPKHPVSGEIIRGKFAGATQNLQTGGINQGATLWYPKEESTLQPNNTHMSITTPMTDANVGQIDGEPWILHSVHFSLEDAIEAAKPVISSVGSENTRILKSIAHELQVKVN